MKINSWFCFRIYWSCPIFFQKKKLLESRSLKEGTIRQKGNDHIFSHVLHIISHTYILLNSTVFAKCWQGKLPIHCTVSMWESFLDLGHQATCEGIAVSNSSFWYPGDPPCVFQIRALTLSIRGDCLGWRKHKIFAVIWPSCSSFGEISLNLPLFLPQSVWLSIYPSPCKTIREGRAFLMYLGDKKGSWADSHWNGKPP